MELETVERIVPVIHPALPYKADNSPGVKNSYTTTKLFQTRRSMKRILLILSHAYTGSRGMRLARPDNTAP